jgi:superfamily II DNA helicase RecQ
MRVKIFNIPITDIGSVEQEMNNFLSNHKVLEMEQHFYNNNNAAYWSFCIRYILSNTSMATSKKKIDYRAILDENTFTVFSKLREGRKIIAAKDGVPAYAVFTDKELADIAQMPILDVNKLIAIKGVGDKKVEKYGEQLIAQYNQKIINNEKVK